MRRAKTRGMNPFAAGLLAIALVSIGTFWGFTKYNPLADSFELKAAFENVNQLKPNSPVRIAGVEVGRVDRVEALEGDRAGALVTMEINDAGLPIKRNASMKVRPRIFLEGNYFIDLSPGTPDAPDLEEGETIPIQQTSRPVQLGEVLTTLQRDQRQDLRIILQELGRSFDSDAGDAFNRSIRWWEPAFKNSSIVNSALLGRRPNDLSNYLRGATRVANGLNRDPEALKNLVTGFSQVADAFASEQENLSAAIRELPTTLRTGQRTFTALNAAFPSVREFARVMTPTAIEARPTLDAQLPLVQQLRRFVSAGELRGFSGELRTLVPHLVRLNRGGVRLQRQQGLLSSCQLNVMLPWQEMEVPDEAHPPEGPIFQEGSKFFVGLGGESRSFDANGQYIRSLAKTANLAYPVGTDQFFLTDTPIQGIQPPPRFDSPPYRPDVPCETQDTPDLRSYPVDPPRPRQVPVPPAPAPRGSRAAREAKRSNDPLRSRGQKAFEALQEHMEESLEGSELGKHYKLTDKPLTRDMIPRVVREVNGR
jgi:phospholipid/cholesterol/gamma-HCH transport system substrate-binding protein